MFELVHTSTQQGLLAGRSGFASVAFTEGIPANLITPVENLSGYKALFPPTHPDAPKNPVAFSYLRIRYGTATLRIISRIAPAGLDYTGRANKIAHHLIFDRESELDAIPLGAVSVALAPENFFTEWTEPARLLPRRAVQFRKPESGGIARNWRECAGDAGWAGVVAEKFRENPEQSFHLEVPAGFPAERLLELVAEVVMQLGPAEVREFTFCTYFSASGSCPAFFRVMIEGTPQLAGMKRLKPDSVLSLTGGSVPVPEAFAASPAVMRARHGIPAPAGKPDAPPPVKPAPRPAAPEESAYTVREPVRPQLPPKAPRPPLPPPRTWRSGDAAEEPEAASSGTGRRKLLFFCTMFLLLATGGFLVFLLFTPEEEPENPPPEVIKTTAAPQHSATRQQEKQPSPPVQLPVSETPPDAPVQSEWPASAEQQLTAAFRLYLQWVDGNMRIELPPELKAADSVSAAFDTVGNLSRLKDPETFLARDGDGVRLLPAKKSGTLQYLPLPDAPEASLRLRLQNGGLVITPPQPQADPELILPEKSNLTAVIFSGGGRTFRFEPVFREEFLKLLGKGTVTAAVSGDIVTLTYLPSDETRKLRRSLSIRAGSRTISGIDDRKEMEIIRLSLEQVRQWNDRAAEFRLRKHASDTKQREAARKEAADREMAEAPPAFPLPSEVNRLPRNWQTLITSLAATPKSTADLQLANAEKLLLLLDTEDPYRTELETYISQLKLRREIERLRAEAAAARKAYEAASAAADRAADLVRRQLNGIADKLADKTGVEPLLRGRQKIDPETLPAKLAEQLPVVISAASETGKRNP
ncbi:MAG: hypothetical protein HPZ91_19650 [Lentisphaeria bacterium]|nr:hypothetical protein [Lentisphaeria bacterium]